MPARTPIATSSPPRRRTITAIASGCANAFTAPDRTRWSDYELLEMVLFTAKTQGDVKPLAKTLIKKFRLVRRSYSRAGTALAEIKGVGDRAVTELKLIAAAASRSAKGRCSSAPCCSSWNDVIDYAGQHGIRRPRSSFASCFSTSRNQLIADEVPADRYRDHTPGLSREVIKRALELSATAILLVHNHPSGRPDAFAGRHHDDQGRSSTSPPRSGISVHDHIIVGKNGHASMRG